MLEEVRMSTVGELAVDGSILTSGDVGRGICLIVGIGGLKGLKGAACPKGQVNNGNTNMLYSTNKIETTMLLHL